MNKLFFLRLILVLITMNLSCSSSSPSSLENPQKIQNVILQDFYKVGACGTIAFAAAYVFTIENSDSAIIGIVRCPDTYDETFFLKGETYKVQLSKMNIEDSLIGYAITNPYLKLNYRKFLISKIYK